MSELDIIIPVYNEAENIIPVLNSLRRHVRTPFRVLICYDSDDDSTLPALRDAKDMGFEIVLVKNRGKGAHSAVTTGFEHSDAPAVIVFSGDDTYNAKIIDQMYEKFKQGSDIVVASRFMKGGCMKGCPFPKSFLTRAASFSLHWFAFIPVKDASNGFRLFSKRILDTVKIESVQGFTYSIELLMKCHRLGWKISEVPACWYERTQGRSRFRLVRWLPYYLRWYAYGFTTTYLRLTPETVSLKTEDKMQNKDTEIEFFNHFVEDRDYDVFNERGYQRIVDEFSKYLAPLRKEGKTLKVIDFGCGTGSFTSRFLNCEFELYGMDISSNCIRYATKKYPSISFEVGDIERTNYADQSFDVVLLTGVLHHFTDFSGLVKEVHRVLKKGGVVLGYDPNRANPFMWMYRSKNSPFYSSKGVTVNERLLIRNEIERVFSSCGFQEIKVVGISGVTYKYLDHSLSFIILPIYNSIERLFDFSPLGKRFGSFLITYARK